MGSVLQCLFQICCDAPEEEQDYFPPNAAILARHPAVAARMPRGLLQQSLHNHDDHSNTSALVREYGQDDQQDDDTEGRATATASAAFARNDNEAQGELPDDCCHPTEKFETNPHAAGIQDFFRRLQRRWHRYDSLERVTPTNDDDDNNNYNDTEHASLHSGLFRRGVTSNMTIPASPLKTAASFDSSREVPTILAREIVLPGSLLQKQMAAAMAACVQTTADDDECVICMEGFDPTNPRMPTLCGCGENKTYFHLPCLYQWIEQSKECPSCRKRLRWEEF
jgi:hypothetical protein